MKDRELWKARQLGLFIQRYDGLGAESLTWKRPAHVHIPAVDKTWLVTRRTKEGFHHCEFRGHQNECSIGNSCRLLSPRLAHSSAGHQGWTNDLYPPSSPHKPPWQLLPAQFSQRLVQGGESPVRSPTWLSWVFLYTKVPLGLPDAGTLTPAGWLEMGKT